jgi:hypothetical protein
LPHWAHYQWFPQLPGNGKGPTQLTLDGSVTLQLALAIVCIKIFVIWAVLRGGAEGVTDAWPDDWRATRFAVIYCVGQTVSRQ